MLQQCAAGYAPQVARPQSADVGQYVHNKTGCSKMTEQSSENSEGSAPRRLNWYEYQLNNASTGGVIMLALLLNGLALILGLLGLWLCVDEDARGNAWMLTIAGAVVSTVAIIVLIYILGM